MEIWIWVIIIIIIIGGLSYLNKNIRVIIKIDDKIKDIRYHLEFFLKNTSLIKSQVEQQNLMTPLLSENFYEIIGKLNNALGSVSKAEVLLELCKQSRNAEENNTYMKEIIYIVNFVIPYIEEYEKATTIILSNIPSHPSINPLVQDFIKKKSNMMNHYNSSTKKLIKVN
jgi:hypothetical protein